MAVFAENAPPKYNDAVKCLLKDRDALLAFLDFPAERWAHVRTTNPIESVFSTVRHRTVRTKGALSQDTARLMVFKLVTAASKSWPAEGSKSVAENHQRSKVLRWNRSRVRNQIRRLIYAVTRFAHSSGGREGILLGRDRCARLRRRK